MKRILALLLAFLLLLPTVLAEAETKDEPPEEIQGMLAAALAEYERQGEKKLKKNNEYTTWYYNDQRQIGWCGVYVIWCAAQGGVPLLKEAQILDFVEGKVSEDADYEPLTEIPDVFVMKEGHVGRIRNGYQQLARYTDIPKPGYQIVYGRIGGTPIIHTAMVESVTEIEDGVWELTTLEGNVGSRLKHYCFRYTLTPKKKHKNYTAVPKDERTRDDVSYKLIDDNWYITGFGITWK